MKKRKGGRGRERERERRKGEWEKKEKWVFKPPKCLNLYKRVPSEKLIIICIGE